MSETNTIDKLAYIKITGGSQQFKLGPLFNKGAYGFVYFAEDCEGKYYAIKASKLKQKQGVKKQDEFMKVCHSNYIMKCYGSLIDKQKGIKFIIMELCDLGSLQDLIYFKGFLSEYQAKIIFKQILCGLLQIHKKRHLHRDIKSSNICFKDQRCLLCDFGCAKQFLTQSQGINWDMTRWKNGTDVGTIISKAPEVLSNGEHGYRTDLWAMGVLFYEMITGIPPFWFKENSPKNNQALQFIKQNINKIYDPAYIKQNFKKRYGQSNRCNDKISQEAKNFLRKLIQFDKKKRLSWQELRSQDYLLQDIKSCSWQFANYILPFKNINWKEFGIKIIEQNFKEQNNDQKQKDLNNSENQIKQKSIVKIQKIKDRNQIQLLYKKYSKIQKKQIEAHNEAKIIHFQIRRLSILMQIRGYLGTLQFKYKQLKCDKVGYMISKYCYLKSKDLIKKYFHRASLAQNLGFNILENLIKPTYEIDQENFKKQRLNLISILKSTFYNADKKRFYEQIVKQEISPIFTYIQQQANKLYNKIKEQVKDLDIQYEQFFKRPVEILKLTYKPTNDGRWGNWTNISALSSYACQMKNEKNQNY